MTDSWTSYPKILTLGHPSLAGLLAGDVDIEEKIDGSQFSFGVFGGVLRCRSKNVEILAGSDPGMFAAAVTTARELAPVLMDGWTYRAEYLQKPKHNSIPYDRVPRKHLMLFDVAIGPEQYAPGGTVRAEAARLGIEAVPLIHSGRLDSLDMLTEIVKRTSILGGAQIEGVVVKARMLFGRDGKPLFGKYVREDFKEQQRADWKKDNPSRGDVLEILIEQYRAPARWQKAAQRLRETGALEGSPRDIGPLLKSAQNDLAEECEAEIKEALWRWAKPHVLRGAIRGLPEWYKERLAAAQFEGES